MNARLVGLVTPKQEKEICRLYTVKKVPQHELAKMFHITRDAVRNILLKHDALPTYALRINKREKLPPVNKASAEEGNPMELAKIMLRQHFYRKQGMVFYKGERVKGWACWRNRIIPDLNERLESLGQKPIELRY
jgi:hypothetical protein